jgi:CDP-diacylglycerol---glycerol-3-phosphate 3-phosphatidyltransferase
MNLPNLLTLLRIFIVPLLVALLVQEHITVDLGFLSLSNYLLALYVFVIAALTDMLDGWLARRWQQITTLGILLDPIADKLLVSAALIALVQRQSIPGWMAILIIGREFAISGLRSIAAAEGYIIKANDLGRTKMVMQSLAVGVQLFALEQSEAQPFATMLMWVAMAFTLISAADYVRQFWHGIDQSIKSRRRKELLNLERQRKRAAAAASR